MAHAFIVLSPSFDDDFGLLECLEYFAVEQLIPEARIEAEPLPGSGDDVEHLGTHGADPLLSLLCDELRSH